MSAAARATRRPSPRPIAPGVPAPDLDLAEAAGVLSRDRAALRPETRRNLRSGRWTQHGDVVVMHNGPLTVQQQEWVALLRCGPGAVLAAWSAMAAGGVRLDPPARPQLVIPWLADVPRGLDADVRRTRVLGPLEVHPARQPPRLRLPRATVDAASLGRTADDVRAQLCLPVQQRLVRVADLRDAVSRLGPLARRSLVLRTLDELEIGATSVHEQRFTLVLRRAGLPQPDRQVRVQRLDRRYYLDAWWDAYQLHTEIDGLAHLDASRWAADLVRANEIELDKAGRRLRFAGAQLFEQEELVIDFVRRGLRLGGYRG